MALVTTLGCLGDKTVDLDGISQTQDFFPSTFEMPVTLRLANVSIEANAKMVTNGNTRTIVVSKDGVTIEEEIYEVTSERIAVKALGTGETFEPPLTLLEVPTNIESMSDWKGKIILGGPQLDASAKIVTSKDRPDLATGPRETLKVAVELRIDDGSPKPAVRKLDFWFAQGTGLVRRDYGNQLRTPR
jgi:hypothetical protein